VSEVQARSAAAIDNTVTCISLQAGCEVREASLHSQLRQQALSSGTRRQLADVPGLATPWRRLDVSLE
jgi:hypothetical protein